VFGDEPNKRALKPPPPKREIDNGFFIGVEKVPFRRPFKKVQMSGGCPRICLYCDSDCILACGVCLRKTVLDVQQAHLRRSCGCFLASQAHSKSRNEAILYQPPWQAKQ